MPLSPSMNVIELRHEAVFMNAGSYVIRPKSSSWTLIFRRSIARIVSSVIGTSYVFPVRLSVMVRVSGTFPSRFVAGKSITSVGAHEQRGCHDPCRLGAQPTRTELLA